MAKQAKITRKELEQDQTLETFEHVFFWISHNRNKVLGLLVAIAVVFLVIGFVRQRHESRVAEASDKFFHAQQVYEKALLESGYATAERRTSMAEVRKIADEIMSGFANTPVAKNALFLKGNAFYFEGDDLNQATNTNAAIDIFQRYLNQAEDDFERAAALLALGYAHENLAILNIGNETAAQQALQAAQNYYDQIIAMNNLGFLRNEARIAKARILAAGGDAEAKETAKELLTTVLREELNNPPEPAADASQADRLIYNVKMMMGQFSTGNSARIQLRRMGVDTDELVEQIQAEKQEPTSK
jgi:tetratricopeptide (TPR) repeat protein